MKTLATLCIALLALTLLQSCSEDSTTEPDTTPQESYWPTSQNSSWTYSGSRSYTTTVGADTTIDDVTYTIVEGATYTFLDTDLLAERFLIRIENGTYYTTNLRNLSNEHIFLKTNVSEGDTWEAFLTINGVEQRFDFTLVEKDITFPLNDDTFEDVIHVNLKTFIKSGSVFLPNDVVDFYYAKGVGLIEANFGVKGVVDVESYDIK